MDIAISLIQAFVGALIIGYALGYAQLAMKGQI